MNRDLSNIRTEFNLGTLDQSMLLDNPIDLFNQWLDKAIETKALEPTAFTLATIDPNGLPDARVVLLKHVLDGKFVFFTNYTSLKAQQLDATGLACMNFCWLSLNRQIRIRGAVKRSADALSEKYFYSRPKSSQIAAIASNQSQPIKDRLELEQRVKELELLPDEEIKRPDTWGGYEIDPFEIEFWQGRTSRLHDRFLYSKKEDGTWEMIRLQP